MTDTMTETRQEMSEGEAIRRDEIARKLITRHVGRLVDAWINIGALQDNYPGSTSDHDWDVLEQIQGEILYAIELPRNKEKENG